MLAQLLQPQSIAIIGASDDPAKPGGKLLHNILQKGYAGTLLPVNPKRTEIRGLTTYPAIGDLPLVPDLALIAIPARFVRGALQELADLGSKVVIVLSAGFGEMGAAGKAEEAALARIADAHDMLMLGPNCSGAVSPTHASKFTGFSPDMVAGGVDYISGSGAAVDFLTEQAARRGVPFNALITVGNSAQSGVAELLGLFDQAYDPHSSPVKILYVERLENPTRFLQHARSLQRKGCVIAGIKSGTTEAGGRAAASHTGALTGSDTAVQALFDKAGIIRVRSRLELVDVTAALLCARGRLDGRRVCIVSDAGGPGVMLADTLNRHGFQVPPLQPRSQQRIADLLPAAAAVQNPVDCLPNRQTETMAGIINIINEEEPVIDYIALLIANTGLTDTSEMYQTVADLMDSSAIPIFPVFNSVLSTAAGLVRFRARGKCYFEDEVSLGRALARIVHRPRISVEPVTELPAFDPAHIAAALDGASGPLSAERTAALLTAVGLQLPPQTVVTEKSALADLILPLPWAMKVIGPLHKSDSGGVRLGIESIAAAEQAWDALQQIDGAAGCLVQGMVSGVEVLLGAKREGAYGHLVAVGLGGIYTEVFRDVQFALAPVSAAEAGEMMRKLRAFPLLEGVRGQAGIDLALLADWLQRIGRLVTAFPQIVELDLNPVKGSGAALYAIDARIIVG